MLATDPVARRAPCPLVVALVEEVLDACGGECVSASGKSSILASTLYKNMVLLQIILLDSRLWQLAS